MPIPFLSSINLTKNEVENFKIYNLANDPGTLTSGGDYGYFWLNTTNSGGTIPTLKWWDGTNVRSLVDSTNIGSFTSGLATDLAGGGAGQIVYQDGANDTKFLAAGTAGQVLSSNAANAPSWLNQSSLAAGTAANISGGLAGQLLYQSALATTAKLTIGTAGQALVVNVGATAPEWVDQSSLSVGSASTATTAGSASTAGYATSAGSVTNALTAGSYLTSGGTYNGSAARTFAVDATDANMASKIVARDGSGNFAAGTITASMVTGLGAPSNSSDATNKAYVDAVAQGIDAKQSVRAATTANIDLSAPPATIDNVTMVQGYRVLVKDQTNLPDNGIYIWDSTTTAMVRSDDCSTYNELVGAFTFVEGKIGTPAPTNANTGWVCTAKPGGTLGTSDVTWVQFSQAGAYTAGNGIVQSGTSFNFAQSADYTAGRIPFASSTTAIGFSSSLNWDSSNNRLGIGTGTPGYEVDVIAPAGVGIQIFENSTTTNKRLRITQQTDHASYDATFTSGGNAHKWKTGSTERFAIDGNGIATWSNVDGNSGTAMTLNGTGLGVGMSPSAILSAQKSSATQATGLILRNPNGTNGSSISLDFEASSGTSGTEGALAARISGRREGAGTTGALDFFTNANGTLGTAKMVLDSSGKLGIGISTFTGTQSLQVLSAIRVSDANPEASNALNIAVSATTATVETRYGTPVILGTNATERLRIASDGVCTWSNVGGVVSNAMVLNGTGLGVGVSPNTILHVRKDFAGYTTIKAENQHTIAAGTGISFTINDGGTDASWFRRHRDGTGNTDIGYNAALRFRGQVTATERTDMVIDTSGNVGIGTPTPGARLDINAGTNLNLAVGGLTLDNFTNDGVGITFSRTTSDDDLMALGVCDTNKLGLFSREGLIFATGGGSLYSQTSEKMRLDGSGNLGLGVTPKAWVAGSKAIQIGTYTAVSEATGGDSNITSNAYLQAANTYKAIITGGSSRYQADFGAHKWWVNSTTNADQTIAYTQAMTLDALGRLGIGIAPAAILHVEGSAAQARFSVASATDARHEYYRNSVREAYIAWDANDFAIFATQANGVLRFGSGNTERLRIKSTGQVNFVGLSSDPAGAAGDVVYNSTSNRLKYHNGTAWVDSGTRKVSVVGGAGTGTYIDATHNFNTKTVSVTVLRTTDNVVVYTDVAMTNDNTVRVTFASSVTLADYTVTVIG